MYRVASIRDGTVQGVICTAAPMQASREEEVDVPEVFIQSDTLELGSPVTVEVSGCNISCVHMLASILCRSL